jgi:hypothetical protein
MHIIFNPKHCFAILLVPFLFSVQYAYLPQHPWLLNATIKVILLVFYIFVISYASVLCLVCHRLFPWRLLHSLRSYETELYINFNSIALFESWALLGIAVY